MVVAVLVLTAACDGGTSPRPRDPAELTYHPSLGVNLNDMTLSGTGLYVQTLETGTGVDIAASGDAVEVHYSGWLPNGILFDSTDGRSSFPVTLGSGGVIAGFDEGIRGMRVDETRLIVIPYQLGYGERNLGAIPAFSTLVFRITLVALEKAGA